jgi:hypothetical protein
MSRAAVLRFMPSALGLLAYVLICLLYIFNTPFYYSVLLFWGIAPWSYPFLDGEFVFTMKDCWEKGYDVYVNIPCDSIPTNSLAYSPLWPRLPLPTDKLARIPVGIVTDVLLILSVSIFLPRARSVFDAVLISLALLSTMLVFALERNNVDVWLYLMITAGVLLYLKGGSTTYTSYGLFFFATLLKYYPIAILVLALKERPRIVLLIAGLCVVGLLIFYLTFRTELPRSLANIPLGRPFGDLVGIMNLPRGLIEIAAGMLKLSKSIEIITVHLMRGVLTISVLACGWWVAQQRPFRLAFQKLSSADATWLVMGCSIMTACYLAGQSVGYRGIYLLPVITGLLALRRHCEGRLLSIVSFAVAALIPLMWMEAIRVWSGIAVGKIDPSMHVLWWVSTTVWTIRELLWLALAGVMSAVLIVFMEKSTSAGRHQPLAEFAKQGAHIDEIRY